MITPVPSPSAVPGIQPDAASMMPGQAAVEPVYFTDEKLVGFRNWFENVCTSGPSFSVSRALCAIPDRSGTRPTSSRARPATPRPAGNQIVVDSPTRMVQKPAGRMPCFSNSLSVMVSKRLSSAGSRPACMIDAQLVDHGFLRYLIASRTARSMQGLRFAAMRAVAKQARPAQAKQFRRYTSRLCSTAAPMNDANSGCGSNGRDFSSGWYCTPMNQGWSAYSMVSGSTPSGDMPAEAHAVLLEPVLVGGVDLVAVAVAFGDFRRAVDLRDAAAALERRRIGAEPHGAAEIAVGGALLQLVALEPFGHQADHRLRGRAELGRVGLVDAGRDCAPPRSPPSACRSRCRNTAPRARARTAPRGFCPRRRAGRSRPAPGCR